MYAKAIVAAVVSMLTTALGSLYVGLDDGRMTMREWVAVALAALVATGLTGGTAWYVPNARTSEGASTAKQ